MARILLNAASSNVRLILRIYFNVVLPFLGLVGDQCCKKRAELTLLQGDAVDITHTTGWLRGTSVAYMIFSFRRSPAGWLGIAMVLCSIFWLVSDLVVSGFVVTVNVVDRCPFNTSIPYMSVEHSNDTKIGPLVPSNLGALWDIVTRATATSQANGGTTGIFRKVNTDANFRGDEKDVIGRWHCDIAGEDQTYQVHEDRQVLGMDLVSKNLLYGNWTGCSTGYIGLNQYLQYAVWSTSVGDWSSELSNLTPDEIIDSLILRPWDVRAALDITAKSSDIKIMRPYHCTLDTKALDFVLGKIQAGSTLQLFCNSMRGAVYRYFRDDVPMANDPGAAIASMLDIIIMMSAPSAAGWNIPPPYLDDPYQGCWTSKTQVPEEAIAVWVVITSAVIAIVMYWLSLIFRIQKFHHRDRAYVKFITKSVPNGLLGWMRQTVRTLGTVDAKNVEYKGLGAWVLNPSFDRQQLQLVRRRGQTYNVYGGRFGGNEAHQGYYPLQNQFPYYNGGEDKGSQVRLRQVQ